MINPRMKLRVVFDLDGTLALNGHREHLIRGPEPDWDAFYDACVDDRPNLPVIDIYDVFEAYGAYIEIWTGRSDRVRHETHVWLMEHMNIDPFKVLTNMRPEDDRTPDVELKRRWLNRARRENREPHLVFDDRNKVVAMWREEKITCCQVAEGDF